VTPRPSPARAALFFALVTLVLTWPMALRPGELFGSRQDLYLGLWDLWWVGDWVKHPWSELFHTDLLFFPAGTGLEVQPLSLFQSVLAAPVTWLAGPLVAYNLLALASFWFAGWVTYLLAREWTGDELGACVAGVVFSFSPYHFTYLPELNLLPVGVVPLYLLCALRLERAPGPRRALVAGAALAAAGLCDWYYGLAAGLAGLVLAGRRVLGRGTSAVGARASERLRTEAFHWGACALFLLPVVLRMTPGFLGKEFAEGAEREGMALVMPDFKGTKTTVWIHAYVGVVALGLAALGCREPRRSRPTLVLAASLRAVARARAARRPRIPLPFGARAPPCSGARATPALLVLTARPRPPRRAGCHASRAGSRARARGSFTAAAPSSSCRGRTRRPRLGAGAGHAQSRPRRGLPRRSACRPACAARRRQMFSQLAHGRPIAGGYLTRRDDEVVRRLSEDLLLGPLLGAAPARAHGPAPRLSISGWLRERAEATPAGRALDGRGDGGRIVPLRRRAVPRGAPLPRLPGPARGRCPGGGVDPGAAGRPRAARARDGRRSTVPTRERRSSRRSGQVSRTTAGKFGRRAASVRRLACGLTLPVRTPSLTRPPPPET
jgi:hypothetical protein